MNPATLGASTAPLTVRDLMDAAVQEVTDYAIFMLDRTGVVQTWNAGAQAIKGYEPDEIIGRSFSVFYPPEDIAAGVPERVLSEAASRGRFATEGWRVRQDGSRFWADIVVTAIHDSQGGVRGFAKITRDLTERRRMEEDLRRSRTLLADAQELLGLGGWEWNLRTGEVTLSDQVHRIFGTDPETFVPTHENCLRVIHPDDRDGLRQIVEAAARESRAFDFPHRIIRPDGSIRHLHCRGSVEVDGEGRPAIVAGALLDVTAEREAEARQEEHARELERSNSELENFAHVASHDLQEPLRMVTSYVQLLKRRYGGKLGEDADEYIEFAVDGATRMSALITDLLTYSRATRTPVEPGPVSTADCVRDALANLKASIDETGAEITIAEDLPEVRADRNQLTQVFQNLIGNALKFHGERTPHVEVAAHPAGDAWELSVADNGIGIAPGQHERIFEVFRRLHTRDEYPGTGLGLAIVKKVVERNGGHIRVDSEPGAGSTFRFTLPAA